MTKGRQSVLRREQQVNSISIESDGDREENDGDDDGCDTLMMMMFDVTRCSAHYSEEWRRKLLTITFLYSAHILCLSHCLCLTNGHYITVNLRVHFSQSPE